MIDPLSSRLHRGAGQRIPVLLMCHAIVRGADTPAWPWAVSFKVFCSQLGFLVQGGCAAPSMNEFAAAPAKHWGRTAVITFDNGYANDFPALEAPGERGLRRLTVLNTDTTASLARKQRFGANDVAWAALAAYGAPRAASRFSRRSA